MKLRLIKLTGLSLQTRILTSLILLLLLPIGILYINEINAEKTNLFYSDYGTFYQSLHLTKKDLSLYTEFAVKISNPLNPQLPPHLTNSPTNLNPPFFAFLIYPLSYLDYQTSLLTWLSLSIACGILAICLVPKIFNLEKNRFLIALTATLAFFAYYPTLINIQFGQLAPFLMPLVFSAWWAARSKKLWLVGLLLGIVASIKLFFGLFALYFLVRREWRALAWFSGTIIICFLLPLTIFHFHEYIAYYKTLVHIHWYTSNWNASLLGFIQRIFGGNNEKNIPLILLPTLSRIIYWLLSGLLIAGLITYLRPTDRIDSQIKCDLDFSLTLTMMLLLAPLGWIYYFPFLFIPFVVLFRLGEQCYHSVLFRLSICTTIILSSMPFPLILPRRMHGLSTIFINSGIYFYALLLLCGVLFFARHVFIKKIPPPQQDISKKLVVLLYTMAFLPSMIGLAVIANNLATNKTFFMPRIELIQPFIIRH